MKHFKLFLFSIAALITFSCDDDDDDGNGGGDNSVELELVSDGYNSPLLVTESPDNSGRLFVLDQTGTIHIIKDGSKLPQPFLNVQDKILLEAPPDERGLLGLAFHPEYASNGKFYIYYSGPLQPTGPAGWDHTNYVAEYKVSGDPDAADPASARIVLAVDHPQGNHNGGTIAFGGDGYLYISIGDGGGRDDEGAGHVDDWYAENTGGNGQDVTQNLLGNVLRIDVNTATGYGIPADNPFVANDGLDEIYAYGLRNPYRFSFASDNTLILADAGQDLYEEINVIDKGGNYGWNVKEGSHCFSTTTPQSPPGSCPTEDNLGNTIVDPVIEFGNSNALAEGLGNVSIGGFVYENDDISFLNGKYIFGVLSQNATNPGGAIFAATRTGSQWDYDKLSISNMPNNEIGNMVVGFGHNNEGDVYVLTIGETAASGAIYKITD